MRAPFVRKLVNARRNYVSGFHIHDGSIDIKIHGPLCQKHGGLDKLGRDLEAILMKELTYVDVLVKELVRHLVLVQNVVVNARSSSSGTEEEAKKSVQISTISWKSKSMQNQQRFGSSSCSRIN
jgi:hypothetical protein